MIKLDNGFKAFSFLNQNIKKVTKRLFFLTAKHLTYANYDCSWSPFSTAFINNISRFFPTALVLWERLKGRSFSPAKKTFLKKTTDWSHWTEADSARTESDRKTSKLVLGTGFLR